jgi:hypothetical protein
VSSIQNSALHENLEKLRLFRGFLKNRGPGGGQSLRFEQPLVPIPIAVAAGEQNFDVRGDSFHYTQPNFGPTVVLHDLPEPPRSCDLRSTTE